MKIKTYRSESVTRALDQIRDELGSEAVILNTRRVKKRKLLGLIPAMTYEITAAVETESPGPKKAGNTYEAAPDTYETAQDVPARPRPRKAASEKRVREARNGGAPIDPRLSEISEDVQVIKRMLSRRDRHLYLTSQFSPWNEDESAPASYVAEIGRSAAGEFQSLIGDGMDHELAVTLVRYATQQLEAEGPGETDLRPALNQAIRKMVETSGLKDSEGRRISIFIGPTGVGKTTTIAKLAAIFALGENKKVQLLTLDTYRIAAAEQLKTYADIIGVPIRVVSTLDELERAIEETSDRDLVLIDTTGHSPKKVGEFSQLAGFLSRRSEIEKHLVLSITTKAEDLREAVERFEIFRPDTLVFTKLDETSSFGSLASEAILSGKPLSCLTNGQAVPEDLQFPTPKTVADLVVPVH